MNIAEVVKIRRAWRRFTCMWFVILLLNFNCLYWVARDTDDSFVMRLLSVVMFLQIAYSSWHMLRCLERARICTHRINFNQGESQCPNKNNEHDE